MNKKKIIVIGTGLAAAVLISRLKKSFDIVAIESSVSFETVAQNYSLKLEDNNSPGLGGTTKLWHNALIKVDRSCMHYAGNQDPSYYSYYDEALKLFGLSENEVDSKKMQAFGEIMAVPRKRVNMWTHLGLHWVTTIKGHIAKVNLNGNRITSITSTDGNNHEANIFVDCSGGLGNIAHLGEYFFGSMDDCIVTDSYEDHLCGYVASARFNNVQRNFSGKLKKGWSYRRPLIGRFSNNRTVAFYFRPSIRRGKNNKTPPSSFLNRVRNGPNRLGAIAHILLNPSEFAEALSARFGFIFNTKNFEIFMVFASDPKLGRVTLKDQTYYLEPFIPDGLEKEIKTALWGALIESGLKCDLDDLVFYENVNEQLDTGAHHSGTFPISSEAKFVGSDYKLKGTDNYYLVSGGQIQESGYSNTGLTISAMALELAELLNEK